MWVPSLWAQITESNVSRDSHTWPEHGGTGSNSASAMSQMQFEEHTFGGTHGYVLAGGMQIGFSAEATV